MLMAPALLLYGVFLVYPTLRGIQLSFTNSQGVIGGQFVGLASYRRLLHDPTVISALKNILIFAVRGTSLSGSCAVSRRSLPMMHE